MHGSAAAWGEYLVLMGDRRPPLVRAKAAAAAATAAVAAAAAAAAAAKA